MSKIIFHNKLLALLLALLLGFSLAACGDRPQPSDQISSEPEEVEVEPEPEPEKPQYVFVNTLQEPGVPIKAPKLTEEVQRWVGINDDTVGWLKVPNTHMDEVVVQNDDPDDYNNYYYRRNAYGEYSFNGCFWADFRNLFGEGGRDELSNNTVIYGHTISPDIDGVKFAPLKYFEQEEFARNNPYVFFSTRKEDLIWEVFAVFYATVDLPYNLCGQSEEEFEGMLKECTDRSIYNYDVEVTGKDKVLTLSTCTYYVPGNENRLAYPNDYRYVVMAKQVSRANATKTEAAFTVNPNPKSP